jgi:virginiamycin B lyase
MSARRTLIALVSLALGLLALVAGAGAATPGEVTSFTISACYFRGIAAAPAGGVLVRQCGEGSQRRDRALTNVTAEGTVSRLAIPSSLSGPFAVGPAGEVWLVASTGRGEESSGVNRVDPDGTVQHFAFSGKERPLVIYDVAVGAEGAAWATAGEPLFAGPGPASTQGKLLRVSADGSEAEFPLPKEIEPRDIAVGADGNLWFTAVEGSYSIEHSTSLGTGYIGRMTPAGTVTVFPTPTEESRPEAIVAGPDGRLWFQEDKPSRIRTIATDGTFGRAYKLPLRSWRSDLAFGPEGDLWIAAGEAGLLRLSSGGRLTRFGGRPEAVVAGVEGDIWTQSAETLRRIVPGVPGLAASKFGADPATGTASVRLGCGGSTSGCRGTLELSLRYRLGPKRHHLYRLRLARVPYSVPAEATMTVTVPIPHRAFGLARRARREDPVHLPTVVRVKATVTGGPTLESKLPAAALSGGPR